MAMYNKYKGNSGRVQRVDDGVLSRQKPQSRPLPAPAKPKAPVRTETTPGLSGLGGELGRIMGKLASLSLETEDLLLILILYLMYRESGDQDFLIMLGAFIFL